MVVVIARVSTEAELIRKSISALVTAMYYRFLLAVFKLSKAGKITKHVIRTFEA